MDPPWYIFSLTTPDPCVCSTIQISAFCRRACAEFCLADFKILISDLKIKIFQEDKYYNIFLCLILLNTIQIIVHQSGARLTICWSMRTWAPIPHVTPPWHWPGVSTKPVPSLAQCSQQLSKYLTKPNWGERGITIIINCHRWPDDHQDPRLWLVTTLTFRAVIGRIIKIIW